MPSLPDALPEFVCFKAHPLKEGDPNHLVLAVGVPVLVQWDRQLTVYSAVCPSVPQAFLIFLLLLLLLLQRSTAVQVRSSVRFVPQNLPSGGGLLPSPTAWSSDQHPVVMLADVSWHTLGRTEGRGIGFGQLVRTHTGKCLKCQSSSDGHSDHNALCAGGR